MKTLWLNAVAMFAVTMLAYASAEASCGTFEVAKGDVKIQSGSKTTPAANGAKICAGDTVITADQSRAKIKMEDGNELNVSPNSKIVLETYQFDPAQNKKKVLLNVLKGKIRAATREENMYTDKAKDGQANTFQVKTKSAVAGVRGTDFLTSFDVSNGKSEVITFRGKVEVGRLGPGGTILNSVQVGVGQTTVVLAGKSPEAPKTLPAVELKQMDAESTAPAAGASNQTPASGTVAADKKTETKEDRQPAASTNNGGGSSGGSSGGSMATGSELSGGTVAERGPASDVKLPVTASAPVIAQQPVIPRIPQQVIDNVQRKATLKINITLPSN